MLVKRGPAPALTHTSILSHAERQRYIKGLPWRCSLAAAEAGFDNLLRLEGIPAFCAEATC